MTVTRLSAAERAARRLERQDDARVSALFAQGSLSRPATKPVAVAEPATYTVTVLPSALKRKAAAQKAAATRRQNRQAKG